MLKKLCFVIVLIIAFTSMALAINKASDVKRPEVKPNPALNDLRSTESSLQLTTVYSTDFENETEWTPYNLGEGEAFKWVSDNSHSPTHSWFVADDKPMTATEAKPTEAVIVSPVVHLPDNFDGYAPKVLDVSYWVDAETPNTVEGGNVFDVFQLEIEAPYPGDNFWHTSTTNGLNGGSSWWCGDENTGTYNTDWRQEIRTPVLNLSAAAGPVMLTFKNAPSSEPGYDYCNLEISADGGASWIRLDIWDEENATIVWYDESYDISAYASAQTLVRWRLESDGGYNSPNAWRIDDVKISDGTTDFLFDDGGDSATLLEPQIHPLSWVRLHYDYDDNRNNRTSWYIMDKTSVFSATLSLLDYIGMDVRFRIRVSSDGYNRLGLAPGYGYYFDDLSVTGQGVAQIDGAIYGVTGLFGAAPGKPFNPTVIMINDGIQTLNGPILWYGSIKDALGNEIYKPVGKFDGALAQGEYAYVPTLVPKQWIPQEPGIYTFEVTQLQINQDGWPINNTWAKTEFAVNGPPFTELVYAENFFGIDGLSTLADYGWTTVNGGYSDDTWGYLGPEAKYGILPGIIGQGPAISGYWFYPDYASEPDSTMDESLISPAIDLSKIGSHNTLFLDFSMRYQPGHPSLDPDYGFQKSAFTVFGSADGTKWIELVKFQDTDNLGGTGFSKRIPVHVDLSGFTDDEKLWLKFNYTAEDGHNFMLVFSDVVVYAGISKPTIRAIDDVPNDQGKQVQMVFRASYNDLLPAAGGPAPVTHYQVWRGTTTTAAAPSFATFTDMLRNSNSKLGYAARTEGGTVWECVKEIPAADFELYAATVPTLWDNVETPFVVAARTAQVDLFDFSAPAVATSKDNLAPSAPGGLVVVTKMDKAENNLTWTEAYSSVDDVAGYKVYRSLDQNKQGDLIATVNALEYADKNVQVGKKYFYTVSATDFAGNESAGTKGTVTTSVGAETTPLPTAYKLDQNYPNPFNPSTTVSFALPQTSEVVMTIYNMSGQAIETIYNGTMQAGYHKVSWNGNQVSAGIYFLELKAKDFQKTIKMTLVK